MNRSADRILRDVSIEITTVEKWEKMLDTITGLFGYAAALVIRGHSDGAEVLVKSTGIAHLCRTGDKTPLGANLFCETVISTRRMLHIPNALKYSGQAGHSDLSPDMVSFLGYPILWPNGSVFGVICVLDDKERAFSDNETSLLELTATVIGDSLKALLDREKLKREIDLQSQAAAALKGSEERFRKIFQQSPAAIMITRATDGCLLDANDACLKLFGYDREEVLGKIITGFSCYGDPSERSDIMDRIEKQGGLRNYMTRKTNRMGADLELSVSIDRINIGDEACLISTLYDITDKNRLENELKKLNERLTLATDSAGIGIWDWDLINGVFQGDDIMYRLYGAEPGKADYEMWRSSIHPEDRERCDREMEWSLSSGTPFSSQFRVNLSDGGVRVLLSYGRVIRDSNGKPVRMLGVNMDVTQKVRAQEQLESSEVRLRRAQQMARVGNWEFDPQDKVFWASEESLNMYGIGYDSPYADAKTIQGAVLPEDRPMMDEAIHNVLDGGPYNVQFRIRRRDNGEMRVLHSVAERGTHSDDGRVIIKGVVHDITDYVNTERRLIESERRYKALFEDTSAVQLVVEMETGIIEAANPAAFAFYGYSPDELIGQRMTVINELPVDALLERLHNAYNRVRNYHELIHRLKSGERRWVASFSGPIDIDGRKFVSLVIHDITDRNEAEKKLRASENRYRNLFHNNAAVQIIVDSDTGMIYDANQAACVYYGYSQDEIKSRMMWELNSANVESIRTHMDDTLRKGMNYSTAKHRRGDGEIRNVEIYCVCVELDGRKLVHAIVHDITERLCAEKELAESEQRFRLFVENAPDAVFVQIKGQFAYVNNKCVQMFKAKSESELIGRVVVQNFSEDFRSVVSERINTLNHKGLAVPLKEEIIVRMDGSLLDVEVSAVPFRYQGENGALVFMRDISERREMEKEKEVMETQLQQKQKMEAIGTLAGGVAHEINNPVTGIINYAQLITESDASDEEIRNFCGEIIYEGRRIAEIVSSLLKFSRQEKKTHSPAQISDILTGTLSLTRTILRHDQITLEVRIPDGLPSIKCRSQQIQQVLMNLITNARDALNAKYKGFSEDKRITIRGGVFERDGRRWLRVTVEDRGTGIPADVIDKIFNPFFTTKPRDMGTGLGLSISHGIVSEHHGELYFETTPGEYTRAVLELPVDNGWNIE